MLVCPKDLKNEVQQLSRTIPQILQDKFSFFIFYLDRKGSALESDVTQPYNV